jgi:uncharacterized protein
MAEDGLKYDLMVENALRQVVREALKSAGEHGLTGQHHFYITFRTDRPDVVLAERLRQQYPSEMTIVLQHQFWGLEVERDLFRVTLSFGGQQERLVVPYIALTGFADPSVKFGLQFEARPAAAAGRTALPAVPLAADETADKKGADVVALDAFRKK